MASENSFDIVSQFDAQEVRNAIDQVQRELSTRYDFKGVYAEVQLHEDDITVIAPDSMKLEAIKSLILQKFINRKLSPQILDIQTSEPAAQGNLRQVMKLMKMLDQEQCKVISRLIRENFPKVKSSIQGNAVRTTSKSRDELQQVIAFLRQNTDIKLPLEFINYR